MMTFTATQARSNFDQFLESAQQHGSVQITKYGIPVAVMLSNRNYPLMQRYYADRLNATMQQAALKANLTEEEVEALLVDES